MPRALISTIAVILLAYPLGAQGTRACLDPIASHFKRKIRADYDGVWQMVTEGIGGTSELIQLFIGAQVLGYQAGKVNARTLHPGRIFPQLARGPVWNFSYQDATFTPYQLLVHGFPELLQVPRPRSSDLQYVGINGFFEQYAADFGVLGGKVAEHWDERRPRISGSVVGRQAFIQKLILDIAFQHQWVEIGDLDRPATWTLIEGEDDSSLIAGYSEILEAFGNLETFLNRYSEAFYPKSRRRMPPVPYALQPLKRDLERQAEAMGIPFRLFRRYRPVVLENARRYRAGTLVESAVRKLQIREHPDLPMTIFFSEVSQAQGAQSNMVFQPLAIYGDFAKFIQSVNSRLRYSVFLKPSYLSWEQECLVQNIMAFLRMVQAEDTFEGLVLTSTLTEDEPDIQRLLPLNDFLFRTLWKYGTIESLEREIKSRLHERNQVEPAE